VWTVVAVPKKNDAATRRLKYLAAMLALTFKDAEALTYDADFIDGVWDESALTDKTRAMFHILSCSLEEFVFRILFPALLAHIVDAIAPARRGRRPQEWTPDRMQELLQDYEQTPAAHTPSQRRTVLKRKYPKKYRGITDNVIRNRLSQARRHIITDGDIGSGICYVRRQRRR
jgi:hypothetical protein